MRGGTRQYFLFLSPPCTLLNGTALTDVALVYILIASNMLKAHVMRRIKIERFWVAIRPHVSLNFTYRIGISKCFLDVLNQWLYVDPESRKYNVLG